jgi:ribosomal protein L4
VDQFWLELQGNQMSTTQNKRTDRGEKGWRQKGLCKARARRPSPVVLHKQRIRRNPSDKNSESPG